MERRVRSLVKVIFFDLGGVVVDVHLDRFITAMARLSGRSFQEIVSTMSALRGDYERFEKGLCTTAEILSVARTQYGYQGDASEFIGLYTSIFSLREEVADLIEELAADNTLSVISNTDALHYDYILRTFPVMLRFSRPITSFEAHVLKPDPAIYRYALKVHGVQPEETFFVDDKAENIAAARSLGMEGVVFSGVEELRRELARRL